MNEQENKISLADYFKSVNTDQSQFNYIDDEKKTPSLKEAQDFKLLNGLEDTAKKNLPMLKI